MPLTETRAHRYAWLRAFFILLGTALPLVLYTSSHGTNYANALKQSRFWTHYVIWAIPLLSVAAWQAIAALAPAERKPGVHAFRDLHLAGELMLGGLGAFFIFAGMFALSGPIPLAKNGVLYLGMPGGLFLILLQRRGDLLIDCNLRRILVQGIFGTAHYGFEQVEGFVEVRIKRRTGGDFSSVPAIRIKDRPQPLEIASLHSTPEGVARQIDRLHDLIFPEMKTPSFAVEDQ